MIHKVKGYKNGYVFSNTEYTETNDQMFQKILEKYRKSPKGLRCLICNSTTAKNFRVGLLSNSIITINNKIADGCFFINGAF